MPATPRLVIDARMVNDGGIGTYLQALIPRIARLRPNWELSAVGNVAALGAAGWDRIANVRLVQCDAGIYGVREQLELPLRSAGHGDVYWCPHYNAPLVEARPLVVTIHDVNHAALPEFLGAWLKRAYARTLMRNAVRRAREILFDSDFSRRETARLIDRGALRGTVVHLGVGDEWRCVSAPRPMPEPYLVYVGNQKRHKNIPFLLRSFARVQSEIPHRLVLIGRQMGLNADPHVGATLDEVGQRVAVLGEVDAATVRQYVAHADAVVTASLYEGFGLPALEAMAAGTACLVSTSGSLPEICGDAALYGDPRNEETFSQQLKAIALDGSLRASLVARGTARAAQFSWDRAAEQTVAVLERLVAA